MESEKVEQLGKRMVQRAIQMGGTCTGEHGVGLGKKKYLQMEFGEETVKLMRMIKSTCDPNGIMNPTKMLPSESELAGSCFN